MPAAEFESPYTPAQREAVAGAILDRRMSAPAACAAAARGELAGLAGFDVKPQTARSWARKTKEARARHEREAIAGRDVGGTLHALRVELVDSIASALRAENSKPASKRDVERLRQIGRAIREAQAISNPTDPMPAKPGHTRDDNGRQTEGATRGGIAGPLLAAARAPAPLQRTDAEPAPADDTRHESDDGDAHGTSARADESAAAGTVATHNNDHDDGTPAGAVRAELARLAGP